MSCPPDAMTTPAPGPGRHKPHDAFRGARHTIAEDPDGNPGGLISPIDAELRHTPPAPPRPGRDSEDSPPDQPDPHEQAEDYELQLPYPRKHQLSEHIILRQSAGWPGPSLP